MASTEIAPGIHIEGVFLVEARYTPEGAERRKPVRIEHLTRITELKQAGIYVEAGAYTDELTSSVILVRAEDEAEALRIVGDDVYVRAGVWGEMTARPFGRVSSEA